MNSLLRTSGLTVRRRWSRKTFGPIDLSVKPGKCIALIGPMGSGKTTFIKGMLGLLPHRGQVKWQAKPFYIPQLIPTPYPDPNFENASPGTKRLRLIQMALESNRKVIIADEPWVYMDIIAKEKARDILLEMLADGRGILIASHDLWEIQRLADEVIFIKDGRVIHRITSPNSTGKRLEEIYKEVMKRETI